MAIPYPIDRTIAGMAALQTASANSHSRFIGGPTGADTRMLQRAPVDIKLTPKFTFTREDAIFTMGSCFARNVEFSLIQAGVRVLLKDFDFPIDLYHPNHARIARLAANAYDAHVIIRSVLNKYSPLSMLNEFQRVLAPDQFTAPNGGLIQIDGDSWYDPQAKDTGNRSLTESMTVRRVVEAATHRVVDASAVFLTLGFTETWLDGETGTVLNLAPPPLLIKKWPNRFRFFNASYEDVLDSLEQIHGLISSRVRPDMKFVVTVSPVPLNTTFTHNDIITANTYSKSTLRAAAGVFCDRHANVDYFPSYEMVMSTHPDLAWKSDRLHVTESLVDAVMGRFVRAYFPEVGAGAASVGSVPQPAVA